MTGVGFDPDPIKVGTVIVQPSKSVKFLGCKIQQNLKWNEQVTDLSNKLRKTASRIRFEGQVLDRQDKKTLYHSWIGGRLLSNSGAYLPLVTETQINELQTACNTAIRAVAGLPRRGQYPLTDTRRALSIDSVSGLSRINLLEEAWKMKPSQEANRTTRSVVNGKLKLPKKTGWTGKMIQTKRLEAWNDLPLEIKFEKNATKAKWMIKSFVRKYCN